MPLGGELSRQFPRGCLPHSAWTDYYHYYYYYYYQIIYHVETKRRVLTISNYALSGNHGPNIHKDTKPYMSSLLVFIDWRYSQSCWYFRPLLLTSAPLTFPMVLLPLCPLPCVKNKNSRGVYLYRVFCETGWGEGSGPQTDKHLPPSTFTYW